MAYPDTYDILTTDAAVGSGNPAGDNNASNASILALEQRVGIIAPGDSRSLEYRIQNIETNLNSPTNPSLIFYGFEANATGWSISGSGSVARDTAVKHTGTASLKLINGSSGQSAA